MWPKVFLYNIARLIAGLMVTEKYTDEELGNIANLAVDEFPLALNTTNGTAKNWDHVGTWDHTNQGWDFWHKIHDSSKAILNFNEYNPPKGPKIKSAVSGDDLSTYVLKEAKKIITNHWGLAMESRKPKYDPYSPII